VKAVGQEAQVLAYKKIRPVIMLMKMVPAQLEPSHVIQPLLNTPVPMVFALKVHLEAMIQNQLVSLIVP